MKNYFPIRNDNFYFLAEFFQKSFRPIFPYLHEIIKFEVALNIENTDKIKKPYWFSLILNFIWFLLEITIAIISI